MDCEQEPSHKSGYRVKDELCITSCGWSKDILWELIGLFCVILRDRLLSVGNMV